VSRQQPIPLNHRNTKCVEPHPALHHDTQNAKGAFRAATSLPDPCPEKNLVPTDELAALRAFFELLSQWDETRKEEIEHE
jgi:hypothetical protein